jgi:hypothetical protein
MRSDVATAVNGNSIRAQSAQCKVCASTTVFNAVFAMAPQSLKTQGVHLCTAVIPFH